jgi:hypothetical protein
VPLSIIQRSTICVNKRLVAGAVFVFLVAFEIDFDEGDGLDIKV